MDALEYLHKRRAELEGARVQVANQYNSIVGGLAELDLMIETLVPKSPVLNLVMEEVAPSEAVVEDAPLEWPSEPEAIAEDVETNASAALKLYELKRK